MKEFDELKSIIDKLRSPSGCPWDREQTHDSLLPYLFEETNEVADCIISKNISHLKEELGDLLLQIMLHSKIEEENKNFSIKEVIEELNNKLKRRHPHVFGNHTVNNSSEVVKLWDKIKNEEKKDDAFSSILDKVPKSLGPILISHKLQKEASKVGFDWSCYEDVLKKIEEELLELKEAINSKKAEAIEHEIGDLFFALINISRFFKIKADVALAKANWRFTERFKYIEKRIKENNRRLEDCSIDELEKLWQEAKIKTKK